MTSKLKNVLIRDLSNSDIEAINFAKKYSGQKTASKAIMSTLKLTDALNTSVNHLYKKCHLQQQEIERLQSIINKAQHSAKLLADATAQTDLFNTSEFDEMELYIPNKKDIENEFGIIDDYLD
jgi:hypothetical protein